MAVTATVCLGLLLGLLAFVYFYLSKNYSYWKSRGVPSTRPSFPFGNLKQVGTFRKSIGQYLEELYNETAECYKGFYAFNQPILLIKDLDMIKSVLVKDFVHFSNRGVHSNEVHDPIGTYNLFMLQNPEWKTMRGKLTPLFSTGKIKKMFDLVKDVSEELSKQIDSRDGGVFDVKELASRFTVDTITSCAFGIRTQCLSDDRDPFRECTRQLLSFSVARALQMSSYFFAPEALVKLFRMKMVNPLCTTFCREVFDRSMRLREASGVRRNDLIDTLIELRNKDPSMSDDKLVAQAVVFLAAGFETSSSTIFFTVHELSLQPLVQRKLRDEIRDVKARCGGEITHEGLQKMKYLDMVVSETLRKYPILPFLSRKVSKTFTFPQTGLTLDVGTMVVLSLSGLHHDPKYFPDPMRYDPERFSDENRKRIPPEVYMPFGYGPHKCIGDRFGLIVTKMGICHIVSQHEVIRCPGTASELAIDPKAFLIAPSHVVPAVIKRIR